MNLPDKSVSAEDVLHYAKTKHKGLPEHVKQAVVNGFMKRAVEFMKRAVDIDIGGAGRVSTNKLDNLQPNVQKYYKDHTATGNTGSKYLNTVNLSPTNIYGHQRSWLSNHPSTKYDVNTHPFIKDYPGNSVVVDMHGHGNRGGGQMFSPDQSTLIGNNEKYHINERQLAKLTNPNAHNVFLESCNHEGAMCGNTLSKVFPNATNIVHVPKNRAGLFGNDYNDPKYFHSSNHPAFVGETDYDIWNESAPPNVYRKVNINGINQWLSHGPYIAGKTNYVPQAEMNNYVHDPGVLDVLSKLHWQSRAQPTPPTNPPVPSLFTTQAQSPIAPPIISPDAPVGETRYNEIVLPARRPPASSLPSLPSPPPLEAIRPRRQLDIGSRWPSMMSSTNSNPINNSSSGFGGRGNSR